ncbi:hypothetical protein [Verrucosispora sp. WMMD573]|uniref:hypothetical protein n=1 Tax=Verrucosispora sp. WMMD573 TaxID=3015149 RepID=UPI00248D08E6|nr:hypothetical protein [Verrucosispora sp. WMMD573]WBB54896.1 hypothetical protein O7601_01785 [Verrucosispora sp. WMMD573]
MTADPLTSADAANDGWNVERTAAAEPVATAGPTEPPTVAPPVVAETSTVLRPVVPDAPEVVRPPVVDAPTLVRRVVLDAPTVIQPAVDAPTVVQQTAFDAPTVVQPTVRDAVTVVVPGDSPTTVMTAVPQPPPVFVDPSGRRRSRLRWIGYALGLVGLLYTGLVVASFAGGPVNADTVLPFVEPTRRPWQPPPAPSIPAVEAPPSTAAPRITGGGVPRPQTTPARAARTATSVPVPPSRAASSPPASPASPASPRPSRSTAPATTPSVEPPTAVPASPSVVPSNDADEAAPADD